MWHKNNIRKIIYSSILIQFKSIAYYDNKIIDTTYLKPSFRSQLIDNIKLDISKVIDLNNELLLPLYTINPSISNYVFNTTLTIEELNPDFSINYTKDQYSHFLDKLIVQISELINQRDNITLDYPENLFNNPNYRKNNFASELTRNYFYASENGINIYRLFSERLVDLMNSSLNFYALSGLDIRNYICAVPFVLCIIAFSIFCVLLSKVNYSKIQIINVFFIIEKKFGDEVIKKCEGFLEKLESFLKNNKDSSDKNQEVVEETVLKYNPSSKLIELEEKLEQIIMPNQVKPNSSKKNKHHDNKDKKKSEDVGIFILLK